MTMSLANISLWMTANDVSNTRCNAVDDTPLAGRLLHTACAGHQA